MSEEKDELVRKNLTEAAELNLYEASRYLRSDTRRRTGLHIRLPVYIQDPLVATDNAKLGIMNIELRWEPGLTAGPTSSRLAVVDWNGDAKNLTPPAEWNDKVRVFTGPGGASIDLGNVTDPHFRQVNAWAIVQSVLEFYQSPQMMGRPIPWGTDGNRLYIVPAAAWGENAFYDRESKSLQFYYFGDSENPQYTCLSHDIVAHETGHAILDGIRPFYYEQSSLQTSAFHEFFGDLTAILTALRHNGLRAESDDFEALITVIGNLAEQFGKAVEGRPYLRTASSELTMKDADTISSAHDLSQVLTAGVYQIFAGIARWYQDPAQNGGKTISPKKALWYAFQRTAATALQALDLCPPVDIQFLDYVRAFIRCDELSDPVDRKNLRTVMMKEFHKRGFCLRDTCDFGEDCEIRTNPRELNRLRGRLLSRSIDRIARSRTEAYYFVNDNREALGIPPEPDVMIVDLYETEKLDPAAIRLPRQIVLEYVWRESVTLVGDEVGVMAGKDAQLLCGGTIVFDDRGNLLSWMQKAGGEQPGAAERRLQLTSFIADRQRRGLIANDDETDAYMLSAASPLITKSTSAGLALFLTPQMRDPKHEGEATSWNPSF